MKTTMQGMVAKEIAHEIIISKTGKRLILTAMIIQLPFMWLPFATQIATAILLGIALSHIKVTQ